MATIRKRNGRWEVQIRIKGKPSLTKTFNAHAEARAWASENELKTRNAAPTLPSADRFLTLSDLLNHYQDVITPLKRGADRERFKLRIIQRHPVAAIPLCRLKSTHIAQYRDDRLQNVTSGTVRRELAVLRHCIEVARREWSVHFPSNPAAMIRPPSPNKARNRRLSKDSLQKLWIALESSQTWYLKPLVTLAVETGMRRGELLSLKWADVNLKTKIAYLQLTKNGSPRPVPLTPVAIRMLSHIKPHGKDQVFPVSIHALRQAWVRLLNRARLDDFRFHDLRHEAISRFFEMGLSVPEVALISGHKDPRMLFRYTHLRAEDLAKKIFSMTS